MQTDIVLINLSCLPCEINHNCSGNLIISRRINSLAHKKHPGSKVKLGEGEQTFGLLFESHPIPMFVYDLKTLAILKVNDALVEKYGYSRDEFQALTLKDILPAQDMARLLEIMKKKQPDLFYTGEWRHQCKDGHVIDVDITSHTLEFDGHSAALVLAQDISARKAIEDMLVKRAQELASVADVSTAVSLNLEQGQLLQSVADLS